MTQEKLRKNIITVYAVSLTLGFSYFVFIKLTGFSVPCLYNLFFGIDCPGCGMTRMFSSLIKFDIYQAFRYNPMAFTLLIIWNIIAVLLFLGKPQFIKNKILLYSLFVVSVFAMFLFGIFRNFS